MGVQGVINLAGEIASHDFDVFSVDVKCQDPKDRDEAQTVNFRDERSRRRYSRKQCPKRFWRSVHKGLSRANSGRISGFSSRRYSALADNSRVLRMMKYS